MAASKKLPLSFLYAARSFGSQPLSFALRRPSPLLRPLLTSAEYSLRLLSSSSSPSFGSLRSFSSRPTTSSLNDPSPNWSNRPPKETILLDGCDFEHWLVVMEPPDPSLTRDEIIDSYIKTLAQVLGNEEEARMSIYSVSTRHYFAFGAKVSEEISYKIKPLPKVRWVLPDSYLDVKNKDYGGEPFIDGKAVPYDPKYHEEWVRNNARANDRINKRDRPRNFDRTRNFERRRENRDAPPMSHAQGPMPPRDMPPNAGTEPGYQNQTPNPQSSFASNAGPSYQGNAQGYQGSPGSNGPGYQVGSPGYPGGSSGYQGGHPSGPSYHGANTAHQPGSSGYQGGNPSGSGYQGGNPSIQGGSPGYHGGSPGYQGGNPANQGGNPVYRGNPGGDMTGSPSYHGGPGYQGGNPSNQGGIPGYQGGNPANQGGSSVYQGGNPGGNMTGSPSYHGSSSGYQGQNAGYQGGNPGHHGGGQGYQGGTQNFRDGSGY